MNVFKGMVIAAGIMSLFIYSCNKQTTAVIAESNVLTEEETVKRIVIEDAWENSTTDGAYEINSAEVVDNVLRLSVTYGGGCEEHDFELVGASAFAESYPVQAKLAIQYDDNGDECRSLLSRDLRFDLTPLQHLYASQYGIDTGTILFRLGGFDKFIRYDF